MKILFPKNCILLVYKSLLTLCVLLIIDAAQAEQSISVTHNIPYNESKQTLDLFFPRVLSKTSAIMFIHGGGFNQGSKEEMQVHAKHYAELGYVTTSINYRLSLESPYPTAINDVTSALNWMKKQATLYNFEADKIILVGYSVGGTLALNVGLNQDNKIAAIIDVAGITDINALINTGNIPQLKEQMLTFLGGKDPSIASPITQVNPKAPPTLVLHGKDDGLIPIWQSISLVDKMKKQLAPVTISVLYNAGHEIMLPDNIHYPALIDRMTDFISTIEKANH